MVDQKTRRRIMFVLIILGLAFAALAGLAERVAWLQSLCGFFSDACKEAAQVALFKVPIWAWGIAFYAALGLSLYRVPFLFPWLLAVGIGVEAALIGIALSTKSICLFCVGNLVVILLVVAFSFEKRWFWRTLAVSSLSFIFSTSLIPGQNPASVTEVPQKEEPRIIARVAGEEIKGEDLEGPLGPRLYDLELQAYRLKQWQLENMIGRIVLQKEAAELGLTLDQMVADKRFSQGIEVSEAEVNEYLERNRNRLSSWRGSPEELKTRLRSSLRQKKIDTRIMDYVKSLYPKYDVAVYLKEPGSPYGRVEVGGDYFTGPHEAAVTVFEFSDYECPACQKGHDVVRQVREIYKDRVKWVFKDFPLAQHKDAAKAAEAARCAGEQGHFWEYQDLLYAAKGQLSPERLREYAAQLKLDTNAFGQCLDDGRFQKRVDQNREEARKAGVQRLPTYIIGGKLITGQVSLERFQELINEELKNAQGGS